MLKKPKQCIKDKTVQGLIDIDQQVQQVGIDVTVKNVYKFFSHNGTGKWKWMEEMVDCGVLGFSNKQRELPNVELIPWDIGNIIKLDQGAFIVTTNEVFSFKKTEFGHIYPRSSLNRCGVSLESAIFDPGYVGSATVLLMTVHNPNGLLIHQNAKIGQMLVFQTGFVAESYKGVYQGKTEVANEVKKRV